MWGLFTDPNDGLRIGIDMDTVVGAAELSDGTANLVMVTNNKTITVNVKESFDEVMRAIAANEGQI